MRRADTPRPVGGRRVGRLLLEADPATAPIRLFSPLDALGTYALILQSAGNQRVPVGRVGRLDLPHGAYAYVGSALGPGGLHARIARHLDPTRPIHWHIDYLKPATRVVEVWYVVDPVRREHAWASAFGSLSKVSIPLRGFGSSDCNCPAHLFCFPTKPPLASFKRALARTRGAGKNSIRTFRPPATWPTALPRRETSAPPPAPGTKAPRSAPAS